MLAQFGRNGEGAVAFSLDCGKPGGGIGGLVRQ